MRLENVNIRKLKPYANNPRYNDEAVDAVEESIEQVGYITPIVVDENYEILAGHTRWKGLNNLGEDNIDVIVVEGLTDEQKRKFRLLDNKTAEIAEWDMDKLLSELEDLDFGDFDFWSKELEKMADKEIAEHKTKEEKLVICPRCGAIVEGKVDTEEYEE